MSQDKKDKIRHVISLIALIVAIIGLLLLIIGLVESSGGTWGYNLKGDLTYRSNDLSENGVFGLCLLFIGGFVWFFTGMYPFLKV